MAPRDIHILIPESREYVTLHGQKRLLHVWLN